MTSTDAFVLVDKPAGVTSFDVVRQVGRALGTKRTGHSGTLDPFATGLLLVLTGNATRLLRFVPSSPKVYLAEIVFGSERDTPGSSAQARRRSSGKRRAAPRQDAGISAPQLRALAALSATRPSRSRAPHGDRPRRPPRGPRR